MQKCLCCNTVLHRLLTWIYCIMLLSIIIGLSGCSGDTTQRQAKHFTKAQQFFDQQQYEKARIETQNVLQLNDKHVEALYLLGLVSEKKKDWKKAYVSFSRVIEELPDHFDAQIKLGQIYLLSGEQDKAQEKVALVLETDSENINARLLQAILHLRSKENAKAQTIVSEILAAKPDHIEATSLWVQILVSQGKQDAALKSLQTAITVHPKDKSLRLLKISLHKKLNQFSEAEMNSIS